MKDLLVNLPGYALRRASAAMLSDLSAELAPLNLRPTYASVLVLIGGNAGATPSSLGRALGIQRANMVPLIAHLEELGLIARTALDGRSFRLDLTALGKKHCQIVQDIFDKHEERLLARIPSEHRAHVLPAVRALWQE